MAINYAEAVGKLVDWMKTEIDASPHKQIAVKIEDIKKEMGPEFEKISDEEVYNGIIGPLWDQGIVITGASKHEATGKNVIVLRKIFSGEEPPLHPYFYPGETNIQDIDAVIEKNSPIIEKTEKIYDILNIYLKKHLQIWPIYAKALIELINTMKADEIWYYPQDNSLTFWWD